MVEIRGPRLTISSVQGDATLDRGRGRAYKDVAFGLPGKEVVWIAKGGEDVPPLTDRRGGDVQLSTVLLHSSKGPAPQHVLSDERASIFKA